MATNVRASIPEYHNVLVVGVGMAGISMGCHLKLMLGETDVRFFEREEELGGTWGSMNKYPGAGCDIPIPLYSFSFAQKKDWTTFFALHDEINSYQRAVCDKFDLTRKIHYKTEVVNAHWDKDLNLWHVYTRPAKGREDNDLESETKHWVCKVLVTAVGGLSQPNECTIPGHEKFKGPLFHSARWDRSLSFANKKVICVGNGCSATQFIPIIAKEATQVTQFVRSKHWYAQRPHNPVDFVVWRWMVKYVPGFASVQRLVIYFVLELSMVMMKNTFIGTWYRNKFANDCRNYIRKTAPKKYHDILIPKGKELIPGCKRRVFDTDYLSALRRDNIELETDPLTEIRENSVVTKSGKVLDADIIVMANGFNVTRMGFPMLLYGEKGQTLQEYWEAKGGPQAYRSCMMSDFPNLFTLMGPNAGTGHFSYVHTAEHNAQFAIRVMAPILAAPRPAVLTLKEAKNAPRGTQIKNPKVAVKFNKEEDEQVWIQSASQEMVYSQDCGSWYVEPKSGRVLAVYPDYQYMYAHRASHPQYQDFNYSNLANNKTIWQTLPYSTRLRNSLGIGALPNVTDEHRRKFRNGDYAVGKGNSYFDKPGKN